MIVPLKHLVKQAQDGLSRISSQSFLSWQGGAALNGLEAIKLLQERISFLEQQNASQRLAAQNFHAAALLALYHHQGASSPVGQPIRKLLGIGQHDNLTDDQIAVAKAISAGRPVVICHETTPSGNSGGHLMLRERFGAKP